MQKAITYKLVLLLLLTINIKHVAYAQSQDWNAIYSSETFLDIESTNSGAKHTEKGKYIILNEEGLKFSKLSFAYGFNSSIISISASLK